MMSIVTINIMADIQIHVHTSSNLDDGRKRISANCIDRNAPNEERVVQGW